MYLSTRTKRNDEWACRAADNARGRVVMRETRKNNRYEAIELLGGKCVGWPDVCPLEPLNIVTAEMLDFDHINDDGAEHRREIGSSGDMIARWVLTSGDANKRLQLLCVWCHGAKSRASWRRPQVSN
jgi:hypothetical protein